MTDRVFVGDSQMREMLKIYAEFGVNKSIFDNMLSNLKNPEFADYLNITTKVHGSLNIVDPGLYGVTKVINLLARCETLAALIIVSALNGNERKIISELSLRKSAKVRDLTSVFKKTYSLEILIHSIPPELDNENITLHPEVAQLLHAIL